ncbi:hypothetical protein K3495_g2949 [Podosphaera aphanis]|nr:hypothetical protein K3495_g2949 [Podosphaera aphanis]
MEKIKEQLKNRFQMKDLGKAKKILGIRISKTGDGLMIDQSQYAKHIVNDFSMPVTKIFSTPMACDAVGELERTPGRPRTDEKLIGD